MARRAIDDAGRVLFIEFSTQELARLFRIDLTDLLGYADLLADEQAPDGAWRYNTAGAFDLARNRAAILRTRMSREALANIEAEGMLDSYAKLAVDCPEGITAHVYRSYVTVYLMQVQHGVMLDAAALAERAGLAEPDPIDGTPRRSVELAKRHLRLLQAVGVLTRGAERWEFTHVPAILQEQQ